MLREIAEYPNSFGPLGPNSERIETDRYTLCMGPGKTWNTVQRQRMRPDEIDDVLDETRSLLRERGRTKTQWEVGSSAEPPDLVEQLLERGLTWDKEPYAVALVLTAEPPAPPPEIVARRVETFDEFAAANAVQWEAFGMRPRRRSKSRARCFPRRGRTRSTSCTRRGSTASSSPPARRRRRSTDCCSTAARPRRTPAAAARTARCSTHAGRKRSDNGTPALITQGGSMSRPILERLGFERVGEIHMLLDEFGA